MITDGATTRSMISLYSHSCHSRVFDECYNLTKKVMYQYIEKELNNRLTFLLFSKPFGQDFLISLRTCSINFVSCSNGNWPALQWLTSTGLYICETNLWEWKSNCPNAQHPVLTGDHCQLRDKPVVSLAFASLTNGN